MRAGRENVLTSGLPVCINLHTRLLPAFTCETTIIVVPQIGSWGVVSSYSSATVSEFHGIPSTEPLTYLTRKELPPVYAKETGQASRNVTSLLPCHRH
jgi:hypothetical protein